MRPRALPGGNWLQPVPNSRSSPGRRLPAARRGCPEPDRGGQRPQCQVGRHLLRNRLTAAETWSSPPGQSPPGGRTTPSPSLPAGRARPLTSCQLAGAPAAHPAPGALRARPPLTLRPSGPTPRRPPGLRSAAAGVAVGGARPGRGRARCPRAGRTKPNRASRRPI